MTDVQCKHTRTSIEQLSKLKQEILNPSLSHAAGTPSTAIKTLCFTQLLFFPRCKYEMQNLALNRSIVLGSIEIYQLFDQLERAFWQNFPHILRNHIGTKMGLAEPKTCFYNSTYEKKLSLQFTSEGLNSFFQMTTKFRFVCSKFLYFLQVIFLKLILTVIFYNSKCQVGW